MKHVRLLVLVGVLVLAVAPAALADWDHEVKWDQLEPVSYWLWQSYINTEDDLLVADDFLCSETGWITDVEFYGYCPNVDNIAEFRITFWDDLPATPSEESLPGELLDEIYVTAADPNDPLGLGWKEVWTGHEVSRFKINLPECDWFLQENGNIYWIGIQGVLPDSVDGFYWKFRDITEPTWGDDAVSLGLVPPADEWLHLGWIYSPDLMMVIPSGYRGTLPANFMGSADMSFKLTGTIPEPATFGLVGLGLLALIRRRK